MINKAGIDSAEDPQQLRSVVMTYMCKGSVNILLIILFTYPESN